jgi:glutamate--cysteine ligase
MTGPRLDRRAAAALIERLAFPGEALPGPGRMGIEAELLALDATTHRVASLERRTLPLVRHHARRCGWQIVDSAKGAPRFLVPGGGSLTFEPGGQIEYASPPFLSPSALLAHVRGVLRPLTDAAADAGIELLGAGIDPWNGPRDAPLQIEAERYRCMDAYFGAIGEAGRRMMRQTASIQVCLDPGADPSRTWSLLNALAPYLTALFANSRAYAGEDTGHASFRAKTWQLLDPARTGIAAGDGDPTTEYVRFALAAPAMFLRSPDGEYLSFGEWVDRGQATAEHLATHLSTLFPEVRPRGYLELRSIDALPIDQYAAPVLLLAGLTLDENAARAAAELLGRPDPSLLPRAALCGLSDAALAATAKELVALAIEGCHRLGELCDGHDVDAVLASPRWTSPAAPAYA